MSPKLRVVSDRPLLIGGALGAFLGAAIGFVLGKLLTKRRAGVNRAGRGDGG